MRTLILPADATPRAWGRLHGERFRGEIHSLTAIRMYLTLRLSGFADADAVLRSAEEHLPILRDYDQDLYEELCGIAEGAHLTPAEIVVLNHYTDLRDLLPKAAPEGPAPGGCSIIWARTSGGPILAQTWDMHATAIPYVMMLYVPEHRERPASWVFTLTGCLGMTGLSRAGLGMAINNLHSTDARVGVVWPALVRKTLRFGDAAAARDHIMGSPIGSGHHYFVADRERAFGIETSGELRELLFDDASENAQPAYIHTNHCLNPAVAARSRVPIKSTTHARYQALEHSLGAQPIADVRDVWERLGSHEGYPSSVCTNMATPENPHGAATCGAVALELASGGVWAQGGFIHNVEPERFAFPESA